MKCSYCNNDAVIYRKYEGRALCKSHFFRDIEKRFLRTIRKHKLFDRGDHVAVGVSGGKDSSVLLYLLSKFKDRLGIEVSAIIVDEGIKGYRDKTMKKAENFTSSLGIKLHKVSFKEVAGDSLDNLIRRARSKGMNIRACTICGVFRRQALNLKAREIKANKVAIGHNLDDEAQSILANYIRGDILRGIRLGAKPAVVEDDLFIPRVKPLIYIPEKEVALYALLKELPVDFAECPYAMESFRWSIRDIINLLEDRYPGTKYSIVKTYEKLLPALRESVEVEKLKRCKVCGEPSSRDVCKACELKIDLGLIEYPKEKEGK